mmetsp:Transcript_27724/g.90711  ORF Transcript_27724/g.90711 Transcript_27724/m.90711 type:complete len:433 (-) Transcript_27724:1261-2559(-)
MVALRRRRARGAVHARRDGVRVPLLHLQGSSWRCDRRGRGRHRRENELHEAPGLGRNLELRGRHRGRRRRRLPLLPRSASAWHPRSDRLERREPLAGRHLWVARDGLHRRAAPAARSGGRGVVVRAAKPLRRRWARAPAASCCARPVAPARERRQARSLGQRLGWRLWRHFDAAPPLRHGSLRRRQQPLRLLVEPRVGAVVSHAVVEDEAQIAPEILPLAVTRSLRAPPKRPEIHRLRYDVRIPWSDQICDRKVEHLVPVLLHQLSDNILERAPRRPDVHRFARRRHQLWGPVLVEIQIRVETHRLIRRRSLLVFRWDGALRDAWRQRQASDSLGGCASVPRDELDSSPIKNLGANLAVRVVDDVPCARGVVLNHLADVKLLHLGPVQPDLPPNRIVVVRRLRWLRRALALEQFPWLRIVRPWRSALQTRTR